MARRRKKRTLKPRVPSRVKRRKRGTKKAEGHQHPELVGLGLLALGVFLGFVVWAGWNGGYVGRWIGDGLEALVGSAAWGLPVALTVVGVFTARGITHPGEATMPVFRGTCPKTPKP